MRGMNYAAGVAAAVVSGLAGTAAADIGLGVTQQGRLITFNTANPAAVLTGVAITGLGFNETVTGIDMRPNDGQVYALGSQNNLYRVNATTGAATLVGGLSQALNGSAFGMDFNPTGPVALRIVSNTRKNYRLPTPGTNGTVIQDTDLAYVAGDAAFGVSANVAHVAYSNNFPGATTTVLYGIDAGRDTLVRFGAPNAGTLNTVGTLGMGLDANVNVVGGFDIGMSGSAFAVTQNVSQSFSTLWGINLMTGAGVNLGEIGGGETLVAFTIIPTPGAASVLGVGLVALSRRRR